MSRSYIPTDDRREIGQSGIGEDGATTPGEPAAARGCPMGHDDADRPAPSVAIKDLPLAPLNPLTMRRSMAALKNMSVGMETLSQHGGPITRVQFAPHWLVPEIVVVSSASGGRDLLRRSEGSTDKPLGEMRRVVGNNLLSMNNHDWLPRRRTLQPLFTKQHVPIYGGHMATSAQAIMDAWSNGAVVDLDEQCRQLSMRALGSSVLGIDLHEHTDQVIEPLRVTMKYILDRISRPVKAPHFLPTPARRRARQANRALHGLARDILMKCRTDPHHDAPLVRALMAAVHPDTGAPLTDDEICDELVIFIFVGHDTVATALTYAFWQLGMHPAIQDRVFAEVSGLGDKVLTPDNLKDLTFTTQVLYEALRLCPPAPAITRVALRDIAVDGYRVRAGSIVAYALTVVHRDPAVWDRPSEFNPDRFGPDQHKTHDRWQYAPFGAGPRQCIGDHYATMEATLALATIVRQWRIDSISQDFPVVNFATTVVAAPILARVTARDGSNASGIISPADPLAVVAP